MTTLVQTNDFTSSAPPSYEEATQAPASRSLEDLLVEAGQNSHIEAVRTIARNHITPKQPNLGTRLKIFFTERWTITTAYPQAGLNKARNVFNTIYSHPTVPYIGAGLLGAATGLIVGVSIPAGFMLGVAVKLLSVGLDKVLDAINSAANRAFNWVKRSETEKKDTLDSSFLHSSFNETIRIVPIAILSFSLGLNSHHLALTAKIVTAVAFFGIGAFALGTILHTQ